MGEVSPAGEQRASHGGNLACSVGSLLADALKGGHYAELLVLVGAAALLLLARTLLPVEGRSRIKIAAVYLTLAVAFQLLGLLLPDGAATRIVAFLFYFFALASSGRSLVLLGVDVVFGRKTQRAPPRIFRDLTQAVVYVVVLMLTLRAIGVEPGSLLTTSALLTAVVGLSLQDTLGNMVSGLALQMQAPFVVGDFVQFDDDPLHVGRVTEVNWRATTIVNDDLVEVIVPNGHLAKVLIRNYSRPSKISRRSVSVQTPYEVSPDRVRQALLGALREVPSVLTEPAPWVRNTKFADSGIEFTVYFFTDDFERRVRTDSDVADRVWYALSRAGISIPFPIRTVHMHQVSEESEQRARDRELSRRHRALRSVDLFDVLSPDKHRALADKIVVRRFAPGEVIVWQGETSNELSIIDRGEVSVEIERRGKNAHVASLSAGHFFGEMALMTGEARKATVRAKTEVELFVVDHAAFQEAIADAPDVMARLAELLADRQAELEVVASERGNDSEPRLDRSKRLFEQIKALFHS